MTRGDMKRTLYLIFSMVAPAAHCQVHEILTTDTAYINSHISEDSVQYFSFKNTKKLKGHWIVYYDGEKQHKAMEAVFKKGKLLGTEKQWYQDGQLLSEKKCENDTCTTDYFYPGGALMQRDLEAIDAVKETRNRFYSAAYCDNGQIRFSPPLNPDSPSAQFITVYYCSGTRKIEFTLLPVEKNLLRAGPYTEWFESGGIKIAGNYGDSSPAAAGKKIGTWNYYNEDGKLIKQERYENGVLEEWQDY